MNKKVKKENLIEETWNIRPNPLCLNYGDHHCFDCNDGDCRYIQACVFVRPIYWE